ncbi:MAG TPA: RNA polymerase sigma factor, partial [Caulobacterales bacterium]|nr:RNA polymerase sigma factor [Caulobacterales bacterium]
MGQAARNFAAMDEPALVAEAKLGEREAFRAIMQRYNQRLFRVARAVVGDDAEAEDVLQEAYLRAFAGIAAFRGEAGLLTWLTAIALNEARGRLRKRRPMVDLEAAAAANVVPFAPQPPDPESEAARTETRQLLETSIDGLPPEFRVVFVLREIEGLSVEATAAQLGLNPATVKTRHFRARRMLRAGLEKKLLAGLGDVFPFLGVRCSNVAARVLER